LDVARSVHHGDGLDTSQKFDGEHYVPFTFAVVYGAIIAAVIYRFRVVGALCLGVLTGAGLYGANYVLFALALGYSSNELHICIEHIVFGMFFAAAYKGASVPRPRWKATGRPVTAEDKS
jgi:hypothetical protein